MTNPYSSPAESNDSPITPATQPQDSLDAIARRTFLAWEKLRLIYIVICGSVVLLLGMTSHNAIVFWEHVIVGGMIANAFYFMGPVIDTYITWLGNKSHWPRYLMFTLGTLFTVIMAVASMLGMMPSQM